MARKRKIPDYIKNTVPYTDHNLDEEEQDIQRRLENGALKPMPRKQFLREKAILQAAAHNYFKQKQAKDGRITIRLSSRDIQALKGIACEEGLPYQTLISSLLHKFVTNYDQHS